MIDLQMPKKWQQIIETDKHFILLPTGRVSGKSKNAVLLAMLLMLKNPYYDILISRASYGSIENSTYAEFKSAFDELDEDLKKQFIFRKIPLSIERINDAGTIYFMGIGGSNKDRTKGFKPRHKLQLVICEETQELKDKESYDQFEASIRRSFGKNIKLLILGNPPAIKAHWFNLFVQLKKNDNDWLVLDTLNWQDILPFLNDYDVKEILKVKMLEPEYYKWMYLGIPTGGLGQVYPMYRKEYQLINYSQPGNNKCLLDYRIVGCVIGVDGAVNNDCTSLVPLLIMSNGQCVVGEIYYHNPKKDGVIGSFPLVEREVSRWFKDLQEKNNLNNPYDYRYSIPIAFVCDSAATELIQALRYYCSNRAEVYAIKKGTILQMVDTVQSALSKNVIAIYDYGGYYNYTNNTFVQSPNILSEQLESLIWNDKQTGYNSSIPNDVSDAFTYGVYFYYKNTENIVWLDDVANKRLDYYTIKKNVI